MPPTRFETLPPPNTVLVAGAGALGLSIAIELARSGARVIVADPAPFGSNASGVAAGMLAPAFECLFDQRFEHFDLLTTARDLWPPFAKSVGVGLERRSALAISADARVAEAWRLALEGVGVEAKMLASSALRRRHLDLAPELAGLSVTEDWRLDPTQALAVMAKVAHGLGVELRRAAVTRFSPGRAVLDDDTGLDAQALVVATGASPSLARFAPEVADLLPIKGHILMLNASMRSPGVVRFVGGYLCPSAEGVLLGATMEPGRGGVAVDPVEVDRLRDAAAEYAPALARAPGTARAGVRAATADGLPIVGRSHAPGVWIAAGARRNGWLLAPLVAQSLAREIIGGAGDPRFSPRRFDGA